MPGSCQQYGVWLALAHLQSRVNDPSSKAPDATKSFRIGHMRRHIHFECSSLATASDDTNERVNRISLMSYQSEDLKVSITLLNIELDARSGVGRVSC